MDIGGVKFAPAATGLNVGLGSRNDVNQSGSGPVATQLAAPKAVTAIGDAVTVSLDVRQERARDQLSREAALRSFIQTRNEIDPRTRELITRTVDTRTGDVVRQFPDEVKLKLREYLNTMRDDRARVGDGEPRNSRTA